MNLDNSISPTVQEAIKRDSQKDPAIAKIDTLTEQIIQKKKDIISLENELRVIQHERPTVTIKWRESIKWCLEIDSKNDGYFVKSVQGIYKCIAHKHRIDVDANIKNKIATTLSLMFKQKLVGRIFINGAHYYGLTEVFNSDLQTLKTKYAKMIDGLRS